MARPEPIKLVTPGPGVVQLEEDNDAPLFAPEHMLAIALAVNGEQSARLANAQTMVGHLATVALALMELIRESPTAARLIGPDGVIVIPNELAERVKGAQIEALETADGDVGIRMVERAPELFVRGGR